MADTVDLDEFLDPDLRFKIGGREYAVPEVEWPVYLELAKLQEQINAAIKSGADDVEGDQWWELAPRVLGPVLDELIADRVGGARIALLSRAAWYFQLGNRAMAEATLTTAGKAPTPTQPEGSGSTSTTPTGSTGSESESETPPPASTTGTTSPQKSGKRSPRTKAETPTAASV